MKKKAAIYKGLTFNIVLATAITILLFAFAVAAVGYLSFTSSLTEQYNETAENIARSAT